MPAVVFYDLELITPADIRRASAAVGADAIHVYPSDAIWPESAPVTSSTIWPQRDYRFRELVMDQFDRLVQAAGPILHCNVDLLESMRYEWVFATEDMFHRGWTVDELSRRYRPAKLHWVANSPRYLQVVRAACRAKGMRCSVDCSFKSRLRYWASQSRGLVRDRLWMLRERHRIPRRIAEVANRRNLAEIPSNPIVFGEIYPNNTNLAGRVSKALEQLLGMGGVFVCGRKDVCDLAFASGVPNYLMDEFGRPQQSTSESLAQCLIQLQSGIYAAFAKPSQANRTESEMAIGDVAEPVLQHLMRVGRSLLKVAAEWAERIHDMVQRLKPRAIVSTTYAGIFGRVLALAAAADGVPAAYIQHGILGEGPFLSHFPYERLLLWGENIVRAYHARGIPLEHMRVVGSPLYDVTTVAHGRSNPAEISSERSATRVLLLASRPGGSVVNATLFERILRATAAAALSKPERSLVVKLHPADHTGIAQRLFGKHERVRVVEKGNVADLLKECDVAIVTSSTTGLEACMFDKPLIEFDPTGTQPMIDYAKYGAAICVDREADLKGAVEMALHDDETGRRLADGRRRLLDDVLDGGRGDATETAAREILSMIKESRVPAEISS